MSLIFTVIRVLSASWHTCLNPDTSIQSPVLHVRWVCNSSVMRVGLSLGCMDHLGPHYVNEYSVGSTSKAATVISRLQCCALVKFCFWGMAVRSHNSHLILDIILYLLFTSNGLPSNECMIMSAWNFLLTSLLYPQRYIVLLLSSDKLL